MNQLNINRRQLLQSAMAASAVGLLPKLSGAAVEESAKYPIGCYTRPWDEHEYRVALDAIAEAGFQNVGLMSASGRVRLLITDAMPLEEASEIGQEVLKRGLKVISVYGGLTPSESAEKTTENLRRLIDRCAASGSPHLLLGGTTKLEFYDPYYQAIAACCEHAQALKVALSIKPHGGQNSTGAQCRAAIEKVNHPAFRLWYDAGNIFYYSDGALDPVDDAKAVDGLVSGFCIKDFRAPKEVLITPGTGRVDFNTVFTRLRAGGFQQGPLVVECLEPGDLPHLLAEAKKAREFVQKLVSQAIS